MNPMIPELRHKLDKFKSWIEMPRLHIVEEMDAIKNEVDIFAERFHLRANKSKTKSDEQKVKDHDKIYSNQRQMIDEVEAFQKKVLAKMPTNELDVELAKKLNIYIEELDQSLQTLEKEPTYEKASELEHSINSAIYEFDCAIKQKSSLLFINVFLLKRSLNSHTEFNKTTCEHAILFGECFGITQPVSEIERDEKDLDEDEVDYEYPNVYAQLDSATTFGVLLILDDDCISKEEFA